MGIIHQRLLNLHNGVCNNLHFFFKGFLFTYDTSTSFDIDILGLTLNILQCHVMYI
jgi:hypothetical protein